MWSQFPHCEWEYRLEQVGPTVFLCYTLHLPVQMDVQKPREGRDPCHTAQGHPAQAGGGPAYGSP